MSGYVGRHTPQAVADRLRRERRRKAALEFMLALGYTRVIIDPAVTT